MWWRVAAVAFVVFVVIVAVFVGGYSRVLQGLRGASSALEGPETFEAPAESSSCAKSCSKVCGDFGAESVWWSVGSFAGRPVEVCGKVCGGSPSEGKNIYGDGRSKSIDR